MRWNILYSNPAVEEASETQAAEEAVAQADKLNSILDQAEVEWAEGHFGTCSALILSLAWQPRNSQRAPDEVVRTLVSSFLLPEVEKVSTRLLN